MIGQGGMDKWMEHELASANRGLVTRKRRLSDLLREKDPRCVTREGESYEFDRQALSRFAAAVPEGEELLLPITLHFSSTIMDSCYISDEVAAETIRRLEGFGEAYPLLEGKMWLPNSLAYAILQKYPTIFQGLFL